jgi:2-hydroxychromene-2-carboxylate isomerase
MIHGTDEAGRSGAMSATCNAWYFDFISPFAYLQWRKLRPLLEEHAIRPVPILFAAVLDALGQRGPAEIPAKRTFTYRHVLWQARQAGVPLRFPPAHPFNPLHALRLCVATNSSPEAIDAIFTRIWAEGAPGDSPETLAELAARFGIGTDALAAPAVKAALRANTEAALTAGVFGVPTLALGKSLFWGNDAHAFAVAVLQDPALLDEAEMRRVAELPVGVQRG